MSKTLDLPHLVRVCEAVGVGRIPKPEATKEFYDAFNPDFVLALLRRLGEAEDKIDKLDRTCRHEGCQGEQIDCLAERVKELEEKMTTILQVHHQSQCGQADGRWWYRYSLAMHEAEKLLGWPTTKPDEPTPEQENGFSDLFAEAAKEKDEHLALTQRLEVMEAICRDFVQWASTLESTVAHYLPNTTILGSLVSRAQQALEGK